MNAVAFDDGEPIVMPAPPDCHAQAYVYIPEPPDAVAVTAEVVSVGDAPVYDTEVGAVATLTAVMRSMLTDTVFVAVWPYESVTVTNAVPVSVSPEVSPVAEKFVEAAEAEPMVMPVPPVCHVHAYVYGPTPPEAVAVTLGVVSEAEAPVTLTEVGETETDGAVTRVSETGSVIVA